MRRSILLHSCQPRINGIGIGISTGFTALAKYSLGVTDKNMLFAAGVFGILVKRDGYPADGREGSTHQREVRRGR